MMLLFAAHVNVTDIFCSVMGEELSTHYIATYESGYSPVRTFIHGKQSVLVYFLSGQIERPLKIELFQTRNNSLKKFVYFFRHAMITVKFTVAFVKTIHTCITQKFTNFPCTINLNLDISFRQHKSVTSVNKIRHLFLDILAFLSIRK